MLTVVTIGWVGRSDAMTRSIGRLDVKPCEHFREFEPVRKQMFLGYTNVEIRRRLELSVFFLYCCFIDF